LSALEQHRFHKTVKVSRLQSGATLAAARVLNSGTAGSGSLEE